MPAHNTDLDGLPGCNISFHDVMNARAEMQASKAPGTDNLPPEVFHELPFLLCIEVWRLFKDFYRNLRHQAPSSWDLIEYVGLPKTKKSVSFEEFRWIAKLSVF